MRLITLCARQSKISRLFYIGFKAAKSKLVQFLVAGLIPQEFFAIINRFLQEEA